jgi:hypothetical protein
MADSSISPDSFADRRAYERPNAATAASLRPAARIFSAIGGKEEFMDRFTDTTIRRMD